MSEINANFVVDPITLTVQQTDPGLTITPDVTNLNIYAGGYAQPQGNIGELQYNVDGSRLGGAANTLVTSGNLRFTNLANLKINGGANAYFLQTDGTGNLTWAQGTANVSGNGTAAGANTQIQISDGTGNFDSAPGFRFDSASNIFYTPGNAEITGNVTANFYFGDGGLLSNIPGGDRIENGNSNIRIPVANGNIFVSVSGNANTVVFTGNSVNVNCNLNVSGSTNVANITAGNLIGPLANGNSNVRVFANSDVTISIVGVANRVVFDQNAARFSNYALSQQSGANNIFLDQGRISMGLENQTLGMVTRVYNNSTNETAVMEFYRTRGNGQVPTAVIANDKVSNIVSVIYADVGNQNFVTTECVDTVDTNDGAGNITSTYKIRKNGTSNSKIELYSPLVKVTSNGSNNTLLYGNGDITTIGNISANLITGTLTTANQPNITNVGTLGNLTVAGNIGTNNITATNNSNANNITATNFANANNITATNWANANNMNVTANISAGNVKTDNLLYANGSPWDFELPAGSNTAVQYNDNGDFGGSNSFTFNQTSNIVDIQYLRLNSSNISLGVGTPAGAQGAAAIAIGDNAGNGTTGQGQYAVALGYKAGAGLNPQGWYAVAIGREAGAGNLITSNTSQGNYAVAIGTGAGLESQKEQAIALGAGAGGLNQQANSVAIGFEAGANTLGNYSISLGYRAGSNTAANTKDNSIIINATGANLNAENANSFVVQPIRSGNSANAGNILYYYNANGEVVSGNGFLANGTSNITIAQNGNTNININTINVIDIGNTEVNVKSNLTATFANITNRLVVGNTANIVGNINANVLQSGNTNITLTPNGNISLNAGGSTTELVITSTGANITGTLNVSANANVANLGANNGIFTRIETTGNSTMGNINAYSIVLTETLSSNSILVGNNAVISGNANVTGVIRANGNVECNAFFVGDGAFISNISVGAGTEVLNGNSNVKVFANSNVAVSISGTSNVVIITNTGINVAGTLNATGNANVGNLGAAAGVFTANVSAGNLSTTGVLSVTGNANVGNLGTGGLIVANGNITGGNLITGGTLSVTGNSNVGNLGTAGQIIVTGNVTAGNLTASSGLLYSNTANIISNIRIGSANIYSNGLANVDTVSTNFINQSIGATSVASGTTINLAANAAQYFTVTIANGSTLTTTINCANLDVANVGKTYRFLVYNSSGSLQNVTTSNCNPINPSASIQNNKYALLQVDYFGNVGVGTTLFSNLS